MIKLKDLAQDVVSSLVVVAVLGRLVDQGQAQLLIPGEIGVSRASSKSVILSGSHAFIDVGFVWQQGSPSGCPGPRPEYNWCHSARRRRGSPCR